MRSDQVSPYLEDVSMSVSGLKQAWSKERSSVGLRGVISDSGITLIATLKPEAVARYFTRLTEEQWDERRHALRKVIDKAVKKQTKFEKEKQEAESGGAR